MKPTYSSKVKELFASSDKSPLQIMFAGKVCEECGAKATVMESDPEENKRFFCQEHAPANFKKWWYDDND